MKNNYTLHPSQLILLLMFVSFSLQAQLKIVKVNPATDRITIKNFGSASDPMDISSYQLCNFPDYSQLGSMTLISGNLNLAVGASVTVVANIPVNASDGEMGLYVSGPFGNAANMRDYMQWGSAGHQREGVAVTAGYWTAGTFINVSPPYNYNGNGTDVGVAFWDTSLSTEDFEQNVAFKIRPNPVESNLSLFFQRNMESIEVEIYNLLGSRITRITDSNVSNKTIDVSLWKTGLYFVKITTEYGSQTKRFIKQ
ncbi:MAG: T9SS type A sorting domain-containing protein [Bacteroidia bacterium]|nr:T9SS type A sorting domain-containing protein [Bacteroidia bacterium]NND26775.1 T9SS type A sorting domain-containing protein [Flavobacteriaceae bacterium]NNE15495.1 T9SS type A sorting domain-containing protein [Saprospiraceae bacterium]RZW48685.1 MAG: T9SS type A sorting domain-containing protein [Flavobacteriaceae bacterium]